MSQGDTHNFGRKVILDKNKRTVYKPRTIFWEELFFSKKSPLYSIFSSKFDFLYQINIIDSESSLPGSGEVKFIKGISRERFEQLCRNDKSFFANVLKRFGNILSYAFFWGISDLHYENLIFTPEGFQVVDCEMAYTRLNSVASTGMIPFKTRNENISALRVIKDIVEMEGHKNKFFENILDGYVEMSIFILKNLNKIKTLHEQIDSRILNRTPIRILLKDTRVYQSYLKGKKSSEMLNIELTQLQRGDVPYFFKFLNDERLYYYLNDSFDLKIIDEPEVKYIPQMRSIHSEKLFNHQYNFQKLICIGLHEMIHLDLFRHIKELMINEYSVEIEVTSLETTRFKSSFGHFETKTIPFDESIEEAVPNFLVRII